MNKISFTWIFSIGVILACWAPIDAKPFQKLDENDPNPTLSCILFGNFGCNVECAIVHELYLFESTGTCNSHDACICDVKARPVVNGMVAKSSSKGFSKSKKSTKLGSSRNDRRMSGFVDNQLDKILGNGETIEKVDFADNLVKFLDENESNSGIQNVFHQIRLCPNGALHDILDEFLKEHGVEEEIFEDDDDDSTWQVLIDTIIDKLISEVGIPYESDELDVFLASDEELLQAYYKSIKNKKSRRGV